jgi:hypothetical protein
LRPAAASTWSRASLRPDEIKKWAGIVREKSIRIDP